MMLICYILSFFFFFFFCVYIVFVQVVKRGVLIFVGETSRYRNDRYYYCDLWCERLIDFYRRI